jgi:hypothetical protein
MQEIDPIHAPADLSEESDIRGLRRLLYLAFAALAILLLILLPPLISVNRYQRRIATSISDSLGRPVHLDKVTLNLLPLPGFTLENFVVDEDPAFGSEPVIRANSVRVTLRLSSLWSRRIEFSTISLDAPSVNLVHTAAGKWNLESILLRAAHIDAAPTAQRKAGPTPRFPYIEATGARLNLKLGHEKTPISLTDADFALWLPDLQQWHLRLNAHPARTDNNASDTGTLRVEGTLGHAASFGQVPIDLKGEWSNAPLGEATRVLFGRDAGLRGEMTLSANAQGTIAASTLQTRLRLTDARRADFVPESPLTVDLQCLATANDAFHAFTSVHCDWPPSGSAGTPTLSINGALPDIRRPASATLDIVTPGLPASTLLQWLRIASARVPAGIAVSGSLTGDISYRPSSSVVDGPAGWSGEMLVSNPGLINPHAGASSLILGNIILKSPPPESAEPHQSRQQTSPATPNSSFVLSPMPLALGGKDPATLEGRIDRNGYTLHLAGMASTIRLLAFANAVPPLGDGLAALLPTNRASGPYRVDLTATRAWGSPALWTDNAAHQEVTRPQRRHRR